MGLAGFIVSLVGIVSCGILSPIGLLLSLIGLFKTPRGFAIAGAIIGAVGSVFMALVGVGIVLGLLGIGAAAKMVGDTVTTMTSAQQAATVIRTAKGASGTVPTAQAGAAMIATMQDAWQTPFRYEPTANNSFAIVSAGQDKQFGTNDDLRFGEAELQSLSPTTMRSPATTRP